MGKSSLEKVTNGHSWGNPAYSKLPDGTLFEWGAVTVPSNVYTYEINLPVEVTSLAQCSIALTPLQTDTDYNVDFAGSTNTTIKIGRKPYTVANTYYWFLAGRWK